MNARKIARKVFDIPPTEVVLSMILDREQNKRRNKDRKEIKMLLIQPGFEMDVFYRNIDGKDVGVAVSVYVLDMEIIRFDCFGELGHYHMFTGNNLNSDTGHVAFTSSVIGEQIQQIVVILRNFKEYTEASRMRRIRKFRVDQLRLDSFLDRLESTLMQFV
jgi:hypothetical protein